MSDQHHHAPDPTGPTTPITPITDLAAHAVFAAAAGVVASAETTILAEQVAAADIAAAAGWARIPTDTALILEAERQAWLASKLAGTLAMEHNRIARRSVLAATLAAEALATGLSAEEFTSCDVMKAHIAAILAAKAVLRRSDAALRRRPAAP